MNRKRLLSVLCALIALSLVACPAPTSKALKSDADFAKAVASSDSAKGTPPDFLAGEKLPNEEFIPKDSTHIQPDTAVTFHEFPPVDKARFRIQVFAGSAVNATKNFNTLSADTSYHSAVFMIQDTADGKWRVWVGSYMTREEADKAKQQLIQAGYTGAWIHEMKGVVAPPAKDLFWVQLGSFSNEAAALKARSSAESKIAGIMKIAVVDKTWKLWAGGYADKNEADALKKKLQSNGYPQCFVVKGAE